VLHEELHSRAFTERGGTLEMAQLWVNLPAAHKMTAPRYQELTAAGIPVVTLPHGAGTVRVIAGAFGDTRGAAETATPVVVWDVRLAAGAKVELPVADGSVAAVFVRSGPVRVGGKPVSGLQLALASRAGRGVEVVAEQAAELLVLGGMPIDEPVAAYGPFVMNTMAEVRQAIADVQAGRLGTLD
jgi:redox-sensitive bicupin YhaK (pirin superfamily)